MDFCSLECRKLWSDFDDCSEKAIRDNVTARVRECAPQCAGQSDPNCLLQCMDVKGAVASGFEGCQTIIPSSVSGRYMGGYSYSMTNKQRDWAIAGGVAAAVVVVGGIAFYLYNRK